MSPVGLTKDTGWQAGARRTLACSVAVLWAWVVSPEGQGALGPGTTRDDREPLGPNSPGVTTFVPGSHYRRKVPRCGTLATFQVRVLPAATGATLALMYQHLTGPEDRQAALEEFERALEEAARAVQDAPGTAVHERGPAE